VVKHVLQNARCTEREVLLAASRRPQRAEVLEEIFRSRRWSSNRRVPARAGAQSLQPAGAGVGCAGPAHRPPIYAKWRAT